MRPTFAFLIAAAVVVFLSGAANAQQCASGRCAVAPAAALVSPSYGYAAPAVAATFVQPLVFVVPGAPTAVVSPPAAAPVQQAAPQYIQPAVQAAPVFVQPAFAVPVVQQAVVLKQHAVQAAPVVVQQQVVHRQAQAAPVVVQQAPRFQRTVSVTRR